MEKKNIIIVVGIAVIAMFSLCGCGPDEKEFEVMVNQRIANALENAEKARRAKPQVIEVRLPEEYNNAVIKRVVVNNSNKADIRTTTQIKIDEHIQKQKAKDDANKEPEVIKLGSLDEYRTLEVLKANELLAKQEVEDIEKQLVTLRDGKSSIEKQISENKGTEVTQQRLQIIDLQIQLENSKLTHARKYLNDKVQIRQQAETALNQRNAAMSKKNKPAKDYPWYNPKGWWN